MEGGANRKDPDQVNDCVRLGWVAMQHDAPICDFVRSVYFPLNTT
jgi:hypothetical protein